MQENFLYPDLAGISPILIFIATIWSLSWKGLGLWKSARKKQKYWFVAILVLNTLGILPIIYLLIQKRLEAKEKKEVTT